MITTDTMSPLMLEVNDDANISCMGMGGPRLVLTLERGGNLIVRGEMGNDILHYNFIASNGSFGTYTCNAVIDEMMINETVLVVGKYIQMLMTSSMCVCVCVCVCVCMRVHTYVCVCVCMSNIRTMLQMCVVHLTNRC